MLGLGAKATVVDACWAHRPKIKTKTPHPCPFASILCPASAGSFVRFRERNRHQEEAKKAIRTPKRAKILGYSAR